jgi:hypothetical protein
VAVAAASRNSGDNEEVSGRGWRLELLWVLEEAPEGLVGRGCMRKRELCGGAPMAGRDKHREAATGAHARGSGPGML